MKFPDFKTEQKYISEGYDFVIGVDEVGSGPIFGPVVSAACVLKKETIGKRTKNAWFSRVRDSKQTTEEERQVLLEKIFENTLAYGTGEASPKEIDKINIHNASLLCKKRAVVNLLKNVKVTKKTKILIITDGKFVLPDINTEAKVEQLAIVKGDTKILSISSASIIAKVYRDNMLHKYHKKYPLYGFDKHKGYGTKLHKEMLQLHGALPLHRKSFLKQSV